MTDFHSHFLPGIDDGSKNPAMSAEMLKKSFSCGIDTIVATPHFYIRHNEAYRFVKKRQAALESLNEEINKQGLKVGIDIPDIKLGAEVYYFKGIYKYDDIDMLTIESTKYILLEMPFNKWNSGILGDVEKLCEHGFNPIIAHIERYLDANKGTTYINDLLSLDVIVQMNGEFFNSFFTRRKAVGFVNKGIVRLLGSDCHNMDSRPPNLDKTFDIIKKRCGQSALDEMDSLGRKILGGTYH